MLPCRASGMPSPFITWSKANRFLVSTDEADSVRYSLVSGGSLLIENVQLEDDGGYVCHAENAAGSDYQKITVKVLMKPIIFKKNWPNVAPVEGENIVLECQVKGIPEPEVTWYLDDAPITEDLKFKLENDKITINKIEKDDSGEWKCVAENEMGSVSFDKKIQVQTIPEIIGPEKQGPMEKDVTEFETLNLECNLEETTGPMPQITWLKDGVPVEDVLASDRLWFSGNRTQLHVYRLEVIESGQYTCKVENRAGSTELEIEVHVQRPPRIQGPPEVNIEVTLSQELELNCPVQGIPLPQVEWYRFGRKLINFDSGMTPQDTKLIIQKAKTASQGEWSCLASSALGDAIKTFHVDILIPPSIQAHSRGNETRTVVEGR